MLDNLRGKILAVYCASSPTVPPVYFEAAQELGMLLGQYGVGLVYGGTRTGLMGAVADAVKETGGTIVGVIPMLIHGMGITHTGLTEQILTENMRERKAIMEARAEGFIALPGGYGTLEEIFEILTLRQLGYHNKPIVLLNTNDFYRPLLALLENAVEQNFLKPAFYAFLKVADTPREALEYIATYEPAHLGSKY
jgi:cytokinin riboside 5'-monophosphate phosphoribohydrolase